MPETRPRGDATRDALVAAATAVFSHDGFHAASTRAIADAAGVRQALIGYHFQSKQGLYLAVFEHIAKKLEERLGPVADAIDAALSAPARPDRKSASRSRHLELLLALVDQMVGVLAGDESAPWAQLIVREQREPTQAFEILYERFFARLARLLTRLVQRIRGGIDEPHARLTVVTILGQMLVFRIGRAGVLRLLGWSTLGEKELALIRSHLRETIAAQLSADPRPRARARKIAALPGKAKR